jgi:hypothetical protein
MTRFCLRQHGTVRSSVCRILRSASAKYDKRKKRKYRSAEGKEAQLPKFYFFCISVFALYERKNRNADKMESTICNLH